MESWPADEMLGWRHGGGFSLEASARIEADDGEGFERLLRYCARPPLAAGAWSGWMSDTSRWSTDCPIPLADGTTELVPTSLELL